MKKFLKLISVLIIYIVYSISAEAQNQSKLDSMLNVLKTAKEDTSKVNLLIDISRMYMNVNPEPMLQYIQQAVTLSDKINYDKGKFKGVNAMAVYYYMTDDLKMALQYAKLNLEKAELAKNTDELFTAYNTIGSIYDAQGEFKLATPFRMKTLEMAEKMKDEGRIASANSNLGINLESLGNYSEALKYYFKALKVREEKKDSVGMANSNGTIGDVYSRLFDFANGRKYHLISLSISEKIGDVRDMIASYHRLGSISLDENKLPEAKNYFLKCLKYCNENNDLTMTAASYRGLGTISNAEKKYDEALDYYDKALSMFEQIGDKMGASDVSWFIGKAYFKKNNFNRALHYFQLSRATAESIGFKSLLSDVYKYIALTYAQSNNFKKAYEYSILHNELSDSLFNEETINKTTEMREKYETENKEKEISILNKDKEIQNIEIKKQKLLKASFIGGLTFVIIILLFGYRVYRTRQVLRLQKIRNRIASDLHDDVGSTLNSISVYSEVAKQKSPAVVHELEQIGDASRKIIEVMSDIVWTINPENDTFENIIQRMSTLAYNLLKAKNIEHTFRADESLNEEKLSLEARRNFYLIFKEALNNLVKYSNATRASITLTNESGLIRLSVKDNGAGFDITQTSRGNGLLNMKTRAAEMNAQLKIESEKGSGTNVELIFKA